MSYDENYYQANSQDGDRPALWMYERFWLRYLGKGPVLDFGCGLGYFARRLARHIKVFGFETNSIALQKLPYIAPEVQLVQTITNFPDSSLGSITALHVFEHIADHELASIGIEFKRILKSGGRILAVMPDFDGRAHALKKKHWNAFSDPTHINLKGAEEWRHVFEAYWKLNVVACFADGYYAFPYGSSRLCSFAGDALRAVRTLAQFALARPLLRQGDGENVIFILEKC